MKNRYWLIIFAIIIIICACVWFFMSGNIGTVVGIYQDGELLYKIDLTRVDEPYEIRVEYNDSENIILVKHNDISVIEADCADQVCVDHGSLGNKTPIICLPNRLVIEWIDDNEELDAVI